MRNWFLMIGLFLVACGTAPTSTPVPLGVGSQQLGTVVANPVDGQRVTLTGPVLTGPQGTQLVSAVSLAAQPTPLDSTLVLRLEGLEQPQGMALVRVTGTVKVDASGPRLVVSESKPIQPTPLDLNALLENTAIYQEQVLELEGTLIVSDDEALLVRDVGEGGVPLADAAQVKIAQPYRDPALFEQLTRQSAAIRSGKVRAVGLWQGKALQIYWISLN